MGWYDPITADLIIGFLAGCAFMMFMRYEGARSNG